MWILYILSILQEVSKYIIEENSSDLVIVMFNAGGVARKIFPPTQEDEFDFR
jgi:hypothetical protein